MLSAFFLKKAKIRNSSASDQIKEQNELGCLLILGGRTRIVERFTSPVLMCSRQVIDLMRPYLVFGLPLT